MTIDERKRARRLKRLGFNPDDPAFNAWWNALAEAEKRKIEGFSRKKHAIPIDAETPVEKQFTKRHRHHGDGPPSGKSEQFGEQMETSSANLIGGHPLSLIKRELRPTAFDVFYKRAVQNLTFDDIANQLNIVKSTAQRSFERSIAKLRNLQPESICPATLRQPQQNNWEFTMPELFTVPQIAKKHGTTPRQVDYAIQAYDIQATRRVGIVRLFDQDAIARILSALARTGALKPAA